MGFVIRHGKIKISRDILGKGTGGGSGILSRVMWFMASADVV